MDSINRNQPEQNRKHLQGADAIAKIKELAEKAHTCFFCTGIRGGTSAETRPMTVQSVDDEGRLWFLSASDSRKNQTLATDPLVRLYFQGSTHSDFLQLDGRAAIRTDRAKIQELWNPILKTWFTEGIEDPRITILQVIPSEGYYWDTKHGNAVAGIKVMVGAMLGTTLDDSIEGRLNV